MVGKSNQASSGAFPSRRSQGDLAEEDLSDISDIEVAGYLNNNKEFLMKKKLWEMMNPDYQKDSQRKPTTVKKKVPAKKIAPSKKISETRIESNAESENKKRPSSSINYDILDKLFDDENSAKRPKLNEPVLVDDETEYSQQSSEGRLLKPQDTEEEEEEEPDWNEDYSNEDVYGRDEEFYGDANLVNEEQDEEEYDEGIIW